MLFRFALSILLSEPSLQPRVNEFRTRRVVENSSISVKIVVMLDSVYRGLQKERHKICHMSIIEIIFNAKMVYNVNHSLEIVFLSFCTKVL